jgi:hypothetical protein
MLPFVMAMAAAVFAGSGLPEPAWADGRVAFLAERLRYPPAAGQADDFRVRTNAALALGATQDDTAVTPLCGGLEDPSEVVRQAVAVALKRLGRPSSVECLRKRIATETNSAVKLQIQRALDAIESAPSAEVAPPQVPGAKYYVAISTIANGTSRAGGEVDRVVREAIAAKLVELHDYQLAPRGERTDAAKVVVAKRNLKGYYLGVSVEKFDYTDEGLRVRVKIAVFTYPGRDLRGEVPAGATLPGVRAGNKGAEDQLMEVVAGRAAELFAENFK